MSRAQRTQRTLGQARDVDTVDLDDARGRGLECVHQSQDGALAGAGIPDDAADLTRGDGQVDVVNGDDGAGVLGRRVVPLGDSGETDEGHVRLLGRDRSTHVRPARSRAAHASRAGGYWRARVSSSTSASERRRSATGVFEEHGGAAGGGLCAVEHGLRVLVDLHELEVGLVVGVLGTRGEDVHVRQRVGVRRVVHRDGVREAQAGVLDEVVVDDRGGDIGERCRRQGRVQRLDRDLGGLGDVGDGREDGPAVLELDQSRGLKDEQRPGLVALVVGHDDGRARGDVLDRVVLARVQAQRVDGRRADRLKVLVRGDVVGREVHDVLELVDVHLAGRQRGVRLGVLGEVDQLDLDALCGCGFRVGLPVRVSGADNTDTDDVAARIGSIIGAARAAGEDEGEGEGQCGRGDELLGHGCCSWDRGPRCGSTASATIRTALAASRTCSRLSGLRKRLESRRNTSTPTRAGAVRGCPRDPVGSLIVHRSREVRHLSSVGRAIHS